MPLPGGSDEQSHCKVSGLSSVIAVTVVVTSLIWSGPEKCCFLWRARWSLSMALVNMNLVSPRRNASDIVLLAGPDGLVCYGLIRV